MQKYIRIGRKFLANLGPTSFARYLLLAPLRAGRKQYRLTSQHAQHPLWVRPRTSDIYVFDQIFCKREYRCLDDVSSPTLIIDCGANVGYSAAYFLTRFPRTELVAIEPDPANFEMLSRNVAPYGARCECVRGAVWSDTTGLVMSASHAGPLEEWGRQVQPAPFGGTPTIETVEIGALLGKRRCVLKMDIEGAEETIFADGAPPWVAQVDAMVIEIHSRHGDQLVKGMLRRAGFAVSECEELIVGIRANTDRR